MFKQGNQLNAGQAKALDGKIVWVEYTEPDPSDRDKNQNGVARIAIRGNAVMLMPIKDNKQSIDFDLDMELPTTDADMMQDESDSGTELYVYEAIDQATSAAQRRKDKALLALIDEHIPYAENRAMLMQFIEEHREELKRLL